MANKEMKEILDDPKLKIRPFTVPEGYFSGVEDGVRRRLETPSGAPSFVRVLKPAFALASMFLVIAGIGYTTMKLTAGAGERDIPSENLQRSLADIQFSEEEIDQYLVSELSAAEFESLLAEVYQDF